MILHRIHGNSRKPNPGRSYQEDPLGGSRSAHKARLRGQKQANFNKHLSIHDQRSAHLCLRLLRFADQRANPPAIAGRVGPRSAHSNDKMARYPPPPKLVYAVICPAQLGSKPTSRGGHDKFSATIWPWRKKALSVELPIDRNSKPCSGECIWHVLEYKSSGRSFVLLFPCCTIIIIIITIHILPL